MAAAGPLSDAECAALRAIVAAPGPFALGWPLVLSGHAPGPLESLADLGLVEHWASPKVGPMAWTLTPIGASRLGVALDDRTLWCEALLVDPLTRGPAADSLWIWDDDDPPARPDLAWTLGGLDLRRPESLDRIPGDRLVRGLDSDALTARAAGFEPARHPDTLAALADADGRPLAADEVRVDPVSGRVTLLFAGDGAGGVPVVIDRRKKPGAKARAEARKGKARP